MEEVTRDDIVKGENCWFLRWRTCILFHGCFFSRWKWIPSNSNHFSFALVDCGVEVVFFSPSGNVISGCGTAFKTQLGTLHNDLLLLMQTLKYTFLRIYNSQAFFVEFFSSEERIGRWSLLRMNLPVFIHLFPSMELVFHRSGSIMDYFGLKTKQASVELHLQVLFHRRSTCIKIHASRFLPRFNGSLLGLL